MVEVRHIHYMSADHATKIHAMMWSPEGEVRGVLQIVHGMQEFAERYDDFARFMCGHGFAVAANDHLGHGDSVRSDEQYGYFAEKKGNRAVILDMRELQRKAQQEYPGVPYFMFGHSMGSFLVRQYICMYGKQVDGVILAGTAWYSAAEALLGMILCGIIARFKGWKYRSPLVTRISVGGYNQKFEPVRTQVDWLTRDEDVVDQYRRDKRTQFMFTLNGYYNMFAGLKFIASPANLSAVPKKLPVFFIAGEMDPVGNYGLGVKKAAVSLQSAGVRDVTCRLYPHDRHEVLNELNRQEVYEDVWNWISSRMAEENV